MGIVDRLNSELLDLVGHSVYCIGVWAARTGRVAMFARARAQVEEMDREVSSGHLMMKQRQDEVHPVQPHQQRPSSIRHEPALVDPLEAGGTSIEAEREEQQQQQPQRRRGEKGGNEEQKSGSGERKTEQPADINR